jgi:acyl-CoA reductase-like NAD-dependent aldehyde dehydrogenase
MSDISDDTTHAMRLSVMKTYKLFINGAFPRSESGRTTPVCDHTGAFLANVATASRKDLRDAIAAARAAQPKWAAMTAYNRGQVVYRFAEMLEARRNEIAALLTAAEDISAELAHARLDECIDTVVWYAGWADKLAQVLSSVNPVAGQFLNVSAPRPSGVVVSAAGADALLGTVLGFLPAIVCANAAVVLVDRVVAPVALTLAEMVATSDVPAGVVNVLTGSVPELSAAAATHGDVDVLDLTGLDRTNRPELECAAAGSIKRVRAFNRTPARSLSRMRSLVETTTVWHTVGT